MYVLALSHFPASERVGSTLLKDCFPVVDIRLVGGSVVGEGRVEIRHAGQWGTVCDDSWSDMSTKVACKQLGYTVSTYLLFH